MRVSFCLLIVLATLLACSEMVAAAKKHPKSPEEYEETIRNKNKRFLRLTSEEDKNAVTPDAEDKEEERDLIIPTIDRPKYRRWFRAHMTPYDVKQVLGLTGLRPLVKPIKRRVYKGYVVYYEEHCRKPEYRRMAFCQPGAE